MSDDYVGGYDDVPAQEKLAKAMLERLRREEEESRENAKRMDRVLGLEAQGVIVLQLTLVGEQRGMSGVIRVPAMLIGWVLGIGKATQPGPTRIRVGEMEFVVEESVEWIYYALTGQSCRVHEVGR